MAHTKNIAAIGGALLLTVPGIAVNLLHLPLSPLYHAIISGIAILGAAFVLLWACDAAQADISASLTLALVALVTVLPEYAVDAYFTWMAGKHPEGQYAQYAIANMTGANRLLIGVAWSAIAVICWMKSRKSVRLDKHRRTEVLFLGLATLYAFVIPIKGTLCWYDGLVFLGIYGWYMYVTRQRSCGECDVEGPAEFLVQLPQRQRRIATGSLFILCTFAILCNAESFSEGLIGVGEMYHVNKFLLVQWLAPLASEAPEFIVAIMFALRGSPGLALGLLVSSKVNQWTLLVGMIPWVYAASSGSIAQPIPMNSLQMHEIFLTAAQSLLAVVMLTTLRLTVGQGLLLFTLFVGQLMGKSILNLFPDSPFRNLTADQIHQIFSALYICSAIALYVDHPRRLKGMWQGTKHEKDMEQHQPYYCPRHRGWCSNQPAE
ncbi:MAG: sodium:calcium antiporter [Armatimonadota bacterium]